MKCPFICCRDRLELCCGTESRRASASAADRAELHTEDGELTAQSAMLLPADGDEGMRGATAVISALLHYPDGSFGAVQKALQLECEPPSEGCSLSGAELEECVLSVSGGELLIDAGASFSFTERSMTQADTVCGAQLDEENPYDAFSAPDITVTSIRGRDMWTLAKTYRTSAAAIEELSALFPPRGDTILIPRAPR